MEVRQVDVAGVGQRYDVRTRAGRWLGVVQRPSGSAELLIYGPDDPDLVIDSLALSAQERHDLAHLLLESSGIR